MGDVNVEIHCMIQFRMFLWSSVRFEISTLVKTQGKVFWVVTLIPIVCLKT